MEQLALSICQVAHISVMLSEFKQTHCAVRREMTECFCLVLILIDDLLHFLPLLIKLIEPNFSACVNYYCIGYTRGFILQLMLVAPSEPPFFFPIFPVDVGCRGEIEITKV